LLRRHIGRRFAQLRQRAGLTQEQAAEGWQRNRATVARMEDGDERVRFRAPDVKALLELYEATEEEQADLLALTAETRSAGRPWWHDYTATALPPWFGLYVTLEDSAAIIREYEPGLVPGLLQTRAYAEQIMGLLSTPEQREEKLRLRSERQSLLTRPRAPHLRVILDEGVLHRLVGGPELMAEQLRHLADAGTQSNVSVRVLPYTAGAHGGMAAHTSFTLLEFPDDPVSGQPYEPPLAYVDSLTGAMYLEKPEEVGAYLRVWADIDGRALNEDASRTTILTTMKELTK